MGAFYSGTSSLNLPFAIAGQGAFTLLAGGSGFTSASVVQWNGTALSTTFGDGSDLAAAVPATLIAAPGTVNITVSDPSSSAVSNAMPFSIASPAAATAGVIQLITIATDGSPANADSLVAPSINADGRYVAFQSAATNLVPGPASGFQDIYLRDTCLGTAPSGCVPSTTRISVTYNGAPTNFHALTLRSVPMDALSRTTPKPQTSCPTRRCAPIPVPFCAIHAMAHHPDVSQQPH